MTVEKMTIHEALAERKILEKRLVNYITNGTYCIANKHTSEKIAGIPVSDYIKRIKGDYDRVVDCLNRFKAINKAIFLSNSITKVIIANKEYTVAEAIWLKNNAIILQNQFVNAMNEQYEVQTSIINTENGDKMDHRVDQYLIALYGNKDSKSMAEQIEESRNNFINNNSYELLDPINVVGKIETLKKEADDFMSKVDAALSISNAITEVEIEY